MSATSLSNWFALDVEIELAAREAVEYGLMEAGALGIEEGEAQGAVMIVAAYFDRVPERELIRAAVLDALNIYSLPSGSVREMKIREVENRDWLGEWKKSWQPTRIGRVVIAPPWSEIEEQENEIVIRIEPGLAFGTGTHESTRLCLTAIERHFRGGSFLDVGTGTGILAIAAAKMFPLARIEACDTDAEAVAIAIENAAMNGVGDSVQFRVGSIDESTASADCVCANLTADVIAPMLPALLGVTCGKLILSGILEAQGQLIVDRLRELGVNAVNEVARDGEWIAVVV